MTTHSHRRYPECASVVPPYRQLTRQRSGFLAGLAAYLLWGLFPLYWPLLEPAGAVEILAHRILWSIVAVVAVLAVTDGFRWARELDRKRFGLLALAAAL